MKNKTVRIKELAAALGVSQGTVSIVLNGRGDEMRISKQTQERVIAAAKEMGYQPGKYSHRVYEKEKEGQKVSVAVFVPYMENVKVITGRVIYGFQYVLLKENLQAKLILCPYMPGQLEKCRKNISSRFCNTAIITGMSEDEDIPFLLENEFDVPIVLYNRPTEKYSSVYVDDYEAGQKVAALFKNKGHQSVGVIRSHRHSKSYNLRQMGFIDGCRRVGLELKEENIAEAALNSEGGAETARMLMEKELPDAVFALVSDMAVGALQEFLRRGVRVPEDVEIVSYGGTVEDYSWPELSYVYMPVEEMSAECLRMAVQLVRMGKDAHPISRIMPLKMVFRETCRPLEK